MIRSFAASVIFGISTGTALAADVHEHGAARMTLVQDREAVSVMLDLPLDSLVGFEHAPRNTREKAALEAAHEQLEQLARHIVLPAAAACRLDRQEIELPHHEDAHDHEHGHKAKHAHEEHVGEHADAAVQLDYLCTAPGALDTLDVGLFKAFPRLERIDAEAATARGQGKQRLRPGAAVWTLPAR